MKLAHEMSVVALLAKPEAANPGPVFEYVDRCSVACIPLALAQTCDVVWHVRTSCILNVGDWFYAVSDDSPSIAKIRTRLTYNDPQNSLIPPSKPLVDVRHCPVFSSALHLASELCHVLPSLGSSN